MMRIPVRFRRAALWFILPAVLIPCFGGVASGTTYRASPEINHLYKGVHTVVLARPDLSVYDLTTGEGVSIDRLRSLSQGVRVPRKDWTDMAVENVTKAVAWSYGRRGVRVVRMGADDADSPEVKETQALFRAVSDSIDLHVYKGRTSGREAEGRSIPYSEQRDLTFNPPTRPFPFPEKQNRFVYGLGSVQGILKRYNAQALVLITGFDEISTSERKALVAAGILVKQIPLPMGLSVPGLPQAGRTSVSIAVVHPSGDILCYSSRGDLHTDLLNPENADKFVEKILSDFPEFKEKERK